MVLSSSDNCTLSPVDDAATACLSNICFWPRMTSMQPQPPFFNEDDPAGSDQSAGPYDRDPLPEADLWFLPPPDTVPAAAMPGPQVDRRSLSAVQDWARAQAHYAAELAGVTLLFGALDMRLRHGPAGWAHRLALAEAAELSWWAGDRIAPERLALWAQLRLTGAQDDAQALARAGWALRRLEGGAGPVFGPKSESKPALAGFFGRHSDPTLSEGPDSSALDDLADMAQDLAILHPVTRAAALFSGWRMLAGQGDAVRDIEAAVLAARVAAQMTAGLTAGMVQDGGQVRGAVFLPLGLRGAVHGPVADRLAQWLRGADQGTRAALRHLDRVAAWTERAETAVAGLQGRTPGLLIDVLAEWPMVTAPMAEAMTRASRASVQRNLGRMQDLRLIREITGQGRYRVWVARL